MSTTPVPSRRQPSRMRRGTHRARFHCVAARCWLARAAWWARRHGLAPDRSLVRGIPTRRATNHHPAAPAWIVTTPPPPAPHPPTRPAAPSARPMPPPAPAAHGFPVQPATPARRIDTTTTDTTGPSTPSHPAATSV